MTLSTSAQGAECLLPPLSSAWLCAGAGKVSDDDPVYSLAPVVYKRFYYTDFIFYLCKASV